LKLVGGPDYWKNGWAFTWNWNGADSADRKDEVFYSEREGFISKESRRGALEGIN
jgi:hypothetical protein